MWRTGVEERSARAGARQAGARARGPGTRGPGARGGGGPAAAVRESPPLAAPPPWPRRAAPADRSTDRA